MTEFQTTATDIGCRLDRFLSKKIPDLSRSLLQKLIRKGYVRINGKRIKKAHAHLKEEEQIVVTIPDQSPEKKLEIQKARLDIIYEDKDMLALNKPAGLVMYPGAGHQRGTLVNFLLDYLDPEAIKNTDPERPGIVHRLDKNTSGVLLIGKTKLAYNNLIKMFADREIEKTYLALVLGRLTPEAGRIESGIIRNPHDREKMCVTVNGKGKKAITEYKVREHLALLNQECSLLEVKLLTGRMHQIRVHFSSINHPIVGDPEYGNNRFNEIFKKEYKLSRQILHSWQIAFNHPCTKKRLVLKAELPDELKKLGCF